MFCIPLLSTLATKGGSVQLPHHENNQALSRWRISGGEWLRHIFEAMPYDDVCYHCESKLLKRWREIELSPPQNQFQVETCHKNAIDASRFGRSANHYLDIAPRRGVFPCTRQRCFIFFPIAREQRPRQRPMVDMVNEGLSDHS